MLFRSKDSPRRWIHSRTSEGALAQGRPAKVFGPLLQKIMVMLHSLAKSGALYSAQFAQTLINELLRKDAQRSADGPPQISKSWTRRLLKHMGMNRKALVKDTKLRHNLEEMHVGKTRLACKVNWLLREFSVPPSHLWNIDETAIMLNPQPERSWFWSGKTPPVMTGSYVKEHLTCTLACSPGDKDVLAQIIFAGKSDRVLPPGPHQQHIRAVRSESHWSTTETLLALAGQIEEHLLAKHGEIADWVLLVDCAPSHVSTEFNLELKAKYPNSHACFVMRNTTYFLQPLDLMYMRSWKSQMRQYVSRHMAAQVLEDGVLPTGLTNSKAELRIDLTQAVAMATTAVAGNEKLRTKGWEHLVMEGTQLEAILSAADKLHAANDLFGKDDLVADNHVDAFALHH